MKKIKKALAILSSIMMISACAVSPIYAEEAVVSDKESTAPIESVIGVDTSINIRTAAAIARTLACGELGILNDYEISIADYNKDGVVNIRDAAAIAYDCATGKL